MANCFASGREGPSDGSDVHVRRDSRAKLLPKFRKKKNERTNEYFN